MIALKKTLRTKKVGKRVRIYLYIHTILFVLRIAVHLLTPYGPNYFFRRFSGYSLR